MTKTVRPVTSVFVLVDRAKLLMAKVPVLDEGRAERGIAIAMKKHGVIATAEAGVFVVKSSDDNGQYEITTDENGKLVCMCEDFLQGHFCKHKVAVVLSFPDMFQL